MPPAVTSGHVTKAGTATRRTRRTTQQISSGAPAPRHIVSYLAFSVPAVLAGLAASSLGPRTTATVYGAVVAALAIAVLPVNRLVQRHG